MVLSNCKPYCLLSSRYSALSPHYHNSRGVKLTIKLHVLSS